MVTRAVTADDGDQPASINDRAKAPEVPNAAAVSKARSRPNRGRGGTLVLVVWSRFNGHLPDRIVMGHRALR